MKQTQQISLGGYAFTIEQDAYQALEEYISKVKSSADSEFQEELVSDIEQRLAELLVERCGKNAVIDINSIQELTSRIGVPENENQDSDQASSESSQQEKESEKNSSQTFFDSLHAKRFYRNMSDRILGGVCSGIGNYFSIDPFLVRFLWALFFAIFFFTRNHPHPIAGFLILLYIIFWIIAPGAKTVQQKCEAEGKPFHFDEFKAQAESAKESIERVAVEAKTSSAVRGFGNFVRSAVGLCFALVGITIIFGAIFMTFAIPLEWFSISSISNLSPTEDVRYLFGAIGTPAVRWSALASISLMGVSFIYEGIKCLFDLETPKWRPGLVIFMLWFAATLVSVMFVLRYTYAFVANV